MRRDLTRPDQHYTILVDRKPSRVDDLGFEILEIFVVQVEPPLQRPIRDSP